MDAELTKAFGPDYINSAIRGDSGDRVIRKRIAEKIISRYRESPERFPRQIDAIDLEDTIAVVCNPENWKLFFGKALASAFDATSGVTRSLMNRLVPPRNALAHGDPLCVRDAERIACYSHDIIDAIRTYLMKQNANVFNIAKILRMWDSIGHESSGNTHNTQYTLYPGEIRVEIEVDSAFSEDSYQVIARRTRTSASSERIGSTKHVEIEIGERDIGEAYTVTFDVIMNRAWHRLSGIDDTATFQYRVCPISSDR